MAMRLVQLLDTNGERIVGVSTAGTTARRVNGATSFHALANEAVAANTTLAEVLDGKGYGAQLDLAEALGAKRTRITRDSVEDCGRAASGCPHSWTAVLLIVLCYLTWPSDTGVGVFYIPIW